jgi:acetylornithine deacetylase
VSDATLRLLRDLVAIDSVNPSLVPGGAGEAAAAARVADELRRAGLDVEVEEAAPGRPNVVGVLASSRPGPALMLCGHLDTVGVEGMTSPFDPQERAGRLYGRGAQDMKGGLAAIVSVATELARDDVLPGGRLLIAAVADEEHGSIGATQLVKRWRADAAVITEPTGLEIAVGHKGFVWIELTTYGRAAHGSRPDEGRDAIAYMGRVLQELQALDLELRAKPAHPIVGKGSLHASFIEGGREWSTYPDRCKLSYERRTVVGESGARVLAEAQQILDRVAAQSPEARGAARLVLERSAYLTPERHALPELLESCLEAKTRRAGASFWTDAAILGAAGIPTVVFGPGGAGLHSIEEYVLLEDVYACREALRRLALRFCAAA